MQWSDSEFPTEISSLMCIQFGGVFFFTIVLRKPTAQNSRLAGCKVL